MSRIIIALALTSSVSALLPAKVPGRVRGVYSAIGRMPLPHQGAAAAVTTAPLASSSALLSVRSRSLYMSIGPSALSQPAVIFSALLLLAGLVASGRGGRKTAPNKSETGPGSVGEEAPAPPPEKVYPIPASSESAPPSPSPPPPSPAPKVYPVPAYPGLVLPHETGARTDNINEAVNGVVTPFLRGVLLPSYPVGKPKSDLSSLDSIQKTVAENIAGLSDMPQKYKLFGSDDFAAQLCVSLESNPFFTASLTTRAGGGFELINYDPVGSDPPYNVKIMREMGRTGPQVNFQFSVKPEGGLAIDGYDVFENGVKIEHPPEDEPYGGSASPLQYFASAALYDLFYVAQTQHGAIHVFHYVLTNALKYASEDYSRLNNWAVDYNSNVNEKYAQVTAQLISLNGNGLLTSPNGLGGTNATKPIIKTNIEAWGRCSTAGAFHDHWFQSPRKELERAGLLREYWKHVDLGAACAISANAALESKSPKLESTNAKLREFIEESGAWPAEENGIKTVRSLLDMMLITGVIHGGTLSMTRLLCKPEFTRWRNIEEPNWGPADGMSSAIGLSTINGVQKDKHACGSKIGGVSEEDITGGSLQKVLRAYDRQTGELQEVYEKKIQERDDFDDVGFLLTDYCTEGFDGKQLTLATYI